MKTRYKTKVRAVLLAALCAACYSMTTPSYAAIDTNLLTGLAAYWPLDSAALYTNALGVRKTKDYVNGYDLQLTGFNAGHIKQGYTNYNSVTSSNSHYGVGDQTFAWTNAVGLFPPGIAFLSYNANVGDLVPPANNPEYTVSMWICAVTTGTNMFGDPAMPDTGSWYTEQFYPGNTDPLWIVRGLAADTSAHWFIRSSNEKGFPPYALNQLPNYNGGNENAGTYGPNNPGGCCGAPNVKTTIVGGTGFQSGAVLDGQWHHLAWTMDTNGSYNVFVDGIYNAGGYEVSSNRNLLPCVIPDRPMTNQNSQRYLYTHNRLSFYSVARDDAGNVPFNGRLDDIIIWNRALSTNEINEVMSNGIPANLIAAPFRPILNYLVKEFPEAIPGDTLPLTWNITRSQNADSIIINNGVGDVKSLTDPSTGKGTVNVAFSGTVTYTITMGFTNGHPEGIPGFTNTMSVTVSNAPANTYAAGWHLLSRFDNFGTTTLGISGPGTVAGFGWASPPSDFSGAADQFNVRNLTSPVNFIATEGNNINTRPALSILNLNSYTQLTGKTNTLFFRMYVANTNCTPFTFAMLLSSKGFFGLGDYTDTRGGIGIQLTRGTGGSPVDLRAYNGPSASLGTYSYVNDIANGDPNGLKKGTLYNVWVDVMNGGQGAAFYSVYIATNGGPRIGLVTNLSDIDYTVDAAAGTNYDRFIMTHDLNWTAGREVVRIDDLYISTNGLNSTVPVPAGAFSLPTPIVIAILGGTNLVYDGLNQNISFTWTDNGCGPYTILRSTDLNSSTNWEIRATGVTSLTYQDFFVQDVTNAFYRITSP